MRLRYAAVGGGLEFGELQNFFERAAKDVLRLWETGAVRPIVGAQYPLEQAGEAIDVTPKKQEKA